MLRARFAPIAATVALAALCLLPVGGAVTTTVLADAPVPAVTQPAPGTGTGGTGTGSGTGDDMGWG
ncbi:hypothetical protein [Streptomyces sp. NPDC051704]|uniref:hypothetical protein n=1 Tax=Streptomyces sp. NPDC051704 TaxID=3365671 RepID=UPI00379A79AE